MRRFSLYVCLLASRVTKLERKVQFLMSQVDDLTAQLDALSESVAEAVTRVSTDLQSLHDEITVLQGQANPDLSGALDKVAAIKTSVDSIDPAPAAVSEPAPDQPPAPDAPPSQ